MKKIKVGYLPLYIKLYDDSNAHYRDPMVNYMNMQENITGSQYIQGNINDLSQKKSGSGDA